MVLSHVVRVTSEIAPDERPFSKAQAIFLDAMSQTALQYRLTNSFRVWAKGPYIGDHVTLVQLATLSLGSKWLVTEISATTILIRRRLGACQDFLLGGVTQKKGQKPLISSDRGSFARLMSIAETEKDALIRWTFSRSKFVFT